jgi:carbon storage regulator CsrA
VLILSAAYGEPIHIGDDITIVLKPPSFQGGEVRIAIDAPREVRILRDAVKRAETATRWIWWFARVVAVTLALLLAFVSESLFLGLMLLAVVAGAAVLDVQREREDWRRTR